MQPKNKIEESALKFTIHKQIFLIFEHLLTFSKNTFPRSLLQWHKKFHHFLRGKATVFFNYPVMSIIVE